MISRFTEMPDARFTLVARIAARDKAGMLRELEPAEDDSPVCWRDGNSLAASQGVWLQEGGFLAKHGSFVDPADLSVYGKQYYVPAPGRRTGLAVSYVAPESEGARAVRTAAELKAALTEGEEGVEPLLLQPSGDFELHGKLVAGWRIRVYQADDEQGSEILVFE